MNYRFCRLALFVVFFLYGIACGYAIPPKLKDRDVRLTMEEMLRYHIEFKQISPLIVKRSFKTFIDQFDPQKVYLLDDDVKNYLDPTSKRLQAVIDGYYKDDFAEYLLLSRSLSQGILRTREMRQELERELILAQNTETARGESYLQFSSSRDQLKGRIKNQLLRVLQSQALAGNEPIATPQQREKIFLLLEKKLQKMENNYLVLDANGRLLSEEKAEHYFVFHLLKSLAKSLDAHTSYFSPEEAFEMRASLEKQFEGIGVLLKENIDGVVVVDLIKGGPADKSGLIRKGDMLVAIDGKPLDGLAYEEVLEQLKGNGAKEVRLTVQRKDEKGKVVSSQVNLMREKIVMDDDRLQVTAEPFGDGFIGKLTLSSFYESDDGSSCEADIRQAIKELKQKGKLLGLVLDMRENSGGFLTQAVKVAGLFITSGVIVISKYAEGEVQYLRDIDGRVYFNGPFVILTSRASASAAEIVAQSLQDYGAALIVGDDRTYGKGTIQYQTVTDPQALSYFKVTVGRYYTVSGKSTQIEGVQADIVVPTEFSAFNIGERYLEYPLKGDRVPSVYVDPLSDLDYNSRKWFQQHYLPHLQKKESTWQKMLPFLAKNSGYRLQQNQNYQVFLKTLDKVKNGGDASSSLSSRDNWGLEDLQMAESVNILKDMILMQPASSAQK